MKDVAGLQVAVSYAVCVQKGEGRCDLSDDGDGRLLAHGLLLLGKLAKMGLQRPLAAVEEHGAQAEVGHFVLGDEVCDVRVTRLGDQAQHAELPLMLLGLGAGAFGKGLDCDLGLALDVLRANDRRERTRRDRPKHLEAILFELRGRRWLGGSGFVRLLGRLLGRSFGWRVALLGNRGLHRRLHWSGTLCLRNCGFHLFCCRLTCSGWLRSPGAGRRCGAARARWGGVARYIALLRYLHSREEVGHGR